jgi:hypothetical protein
MNTAIKTLRKDLDDLVPLHQGLDGMRLVDIMTVHLGRLDQYTDCLLRDYMELIEQCDTQTEMRILTSISALSKRERLIIGRAFRKLHLSEQLHVKIVTPEMYVINKHTDFLFSHYITMIENNSNNIKKMTDVIKELSITERSIMSIAYSMYMLSDIRRLLE